MVWMCVCFLFECEFENKCFKSWNKIETIQVMGWKFDVNVLWVLVFFYNYEFHVDLNTKHKK